jgi:hypothetical protein
MLIPWLKCSVSRLWYLTVVAHVGGRQVWWWWGFDLAGFLCIGSFEGCGGVFSGEILVGLIDTDAVPPPGGTIPFWRASWLPYVHFPLCARGNPRTIWSGQQRIAFLLEGAAWYLTIRCLERGGTFSEGAAVAGRRRLVDLPLSPFCFSCGHVLAVAPAFYFVSKLFACIGWLLY